MSWPELTLADWEETRAALHMCTQIVGKVRLALAPMVNHWWQVPLYVSARGLTTSLIHVGERGVELELDFVHAALHVRTTDGDERLVSLFGGLTVASFYAATMTALAELDVPVQILDRPVEVEDAIPFSQDVRRVEDLYAARRFWLALVQADRVMAQFRGRFIGKVSPVHFFWGAADLAVTRFSGRTAPLHPGGVPNCADWVQQLAYSHEVSSCGFWPGGSEEGSFYSYAYPAPAGFADFPITTPGAYFDAALGEFLLPYRAVRTADDPDALLVDFFQQTYVAAADLGNWDRAALEA